ncbi:hypothetical protein [Nannocystis sp. SCPEA4]|uniref:hypothetical protein n=1 Tax=Nannocystis sp. SCPEA4 TaxID=2996787 RepID=UPI00226FC277|nr:hypothetical protein [Nannocystis sp. SCPEA4]MCY1060131.1 hypothetical protein [Nannocystis sp. SCPEA4]
MSLETLCRAVAGLCVLVCPLLLAGCTERSLGDEGTGTSGTSGSLPGDPSAGPDGSSITTPTTTATSVTTNPGTATGVTVTTEPPVVTTSVSATATDPGDTETFGATFGPMTGVGDILPPDAGAPSFGCDLWNNDCPAGQKCASFSQSGEAWDGSRCVDIAPNPGGLGDPCSVADHVFSGQDTCGEHMMCWEVDEQTLTGTCIAMCTGSEFDPSCPAETSCVIANDGALIACIPDCDPLDPDTCGEDLCVFLPGEDGGPPQFFCVVDAGEDPGQALDPCEFLNVCDPTLICVESVLVPQCDQTFLGCCIPFCDVTEPNICAALGLECVPLFAQGEAPGKETLGTCMPPP